jgi:IclR helix-turn-helix domain
MLKGQDILVLAALAGRQQPPPTLAALASETQLPLSMVQRSVKALQEARLVDGSRTVQPAQMDEFCAHALRYMFPAQFHGESRGMPTAWSAAPLRDELAPSDSPPLVWPHPLGEIRGIALEPLHAAVPEAARRNPDLGERLALFDALRLDDARVRALAREKLQERLRAAVSRA